MVFSRHTPTFLCPLRARRGLVVGLLQHRHQGEAAARQQDAVEQRAVLEELRAAHLAPAAAVGDVELELGIVLLVEGLPLGSSRWSELRTPVLFHRVLVALCQCK